MVHSGPKSIAKSMLFFLTFFRCTCMDTFSGEATIVIFILTTHHNPRLNSKPTDDEKTLFALSTSLF